MLCPIGQSNEKPPLQVLAKWREYVTIFPITKVAFDEYFGFTDDEVRDMLHYYELDYLRWNFRYRSF